jgi:hypothetical protein
VHADDHGLEKSELSHMKLSLEQTAALANRLRHPGCHDDDDDDDDSCLCDFSSSCFAELLSLVEVDFENNAAISVLASGLEDNFSLFTFRASNCNLSDAHVAEPMQSLMFHPLLTVLGLSRNHGGSKAVKALAWMLEEDVLEIVHFAHQSRCLSARHVQMLAEALEGNECFEILNLLGNEVDDEGVGHLARILLTCPQLQDLLLADNNVSVRGLETLAAQNHPSSLRKPQLCGDVFAVEDGACHHLLNLLEGNPQMSRVSTKIGWKASESELLPQIQHLLDFNKSGRVLVAGQLTLPVPLSIWPLVLAQANQLFASPGEASHQANVIFHLLQGQAARLLEPRLAPQDGLEAQTSSSSSS